MNHNECIACHLKSERWKRSWSQAFVCNNLHISIRTLSRAENGKGISKTILKKLCFLYQIPISQMYLDVDMDVIEKKQQPVGLIPDDVAVDLVMRNSLVTDIQRETILRFNDIIRKDALMLRNDIEDFLSELITQKQSYTMTDIITCCMAINQKTIENIARMQILG